jgi:hypothetical protein
MSNDINHASGSKPRVYPWNSDTQPIDIDRVLNINGGVNQPQEFVYEAGRLDKVCTDLKILEEKCTVSQLEYGEVDFYLALANKAALPSGGLVLSDFDGSLVDIISVIKDKFNGVVEQTLVLSKLSLNSIALKVASSDARIERSFDLGGDFFNIIKNNEKIYMQKIYTVPSGYSAAPYAISVTDPVPVVNANVAGKYIHRIIRVRSGVTTELALTTDYTFTAPSALNILLATSGDIIKVVYHAASFGTAGDYTSLNNTDLCFITADSIKVTLQSGVGTEVELDRLTSLDITATLNRISEGVLGLREKLLKNIQTYDVKVALNARIKNTPIEDVLMGQAGNNWGDIDPNFFKTDLVLRVYIYENSSKTNFKIGYKSSAMAFADENQDVNANDFWSKTINLSSDNMLISDVEGDIDA